VAHASALDRVVHLRGHRIVRGCDGDDGSGDADGDDDGEGDSDGDSDTDGDTSGTSAGTSPGQPQPLTKDDVRKQLRDHARQQIEHDEDAQDDLASILDALDYGRGGDPAEGADPQGRFIEASDRARALHRDIGDALLDLKDDSEPGWLKRTDSGRLNVRRLLGGSDADELFDRYEPGMMDASELELVLLLDVSSSMNGKLTALGEATWAIRQAVDDLEGRCTVFTYDSGPHRVLADASARPDGRMFVPQALGGTAPLTALTEAFRLIAGSDAKNRLVVILTDGSWTGTTQSETVIRAMNEHGVTTVCALLGAGGMFGHETSDLHGCSFGGPIDDPLELARMFRRIASDRIRSNW